MFDNIKLKTTQVYTDKTRKPGNQPDRWRFYEANMDKDVASIV